MDEQVVELIFPYYYIILQSHLSINLMHERIANCKHFEYFPKGKQDYQMNNI